jgi:hypothetical protein
MSFVVSGVRFVAGDCPEQATKRAEAAWRIAVTTAKAGVDVRRCPEVWPS